MKTLGLVLLLGSITFIQAQIDVGKGMALKDITWFYESERKGENITKILFHFNDPGAKYYHTRKGDKIHIEFYDAVLDRAPTAMPMHSPFSNLEIETKNDNIQVQEDLSPDLRDMVRIELTVEKDIETDYMLSETGSVVTLTAVWTRSGSLTIQQTKSKSKIWPYVITGVAVAAVTAGVVYIISSSSDSKNDGIYVKPQ